MNRSCNIQIIGDGSGNTLVFVNGQPFNGNYFCEYQLHEGLLRLLEKYLTKYEPQDKQQEVVETLPF